MELLCEITNTEEDDDDDDDENQSTDKDTQSENFVKNEENKEVHDNSGKGSTDRNKISKQSAMKSGNTDEECQKVEKASYGDEFVDQLNSQSGKVEEAIIVSETRFRSSIVFPSLGLRKTLKEGTELVAILRKLLRQRTHYVTDERDSDGNKAGKVVCNADGIHAVLDPIAVITLYNKQKKLTRDKKKWKKFFDEAEYEIDICKDRSNRDNYSIFTMTPLPHFSPIFRSQIKCIDGVDPEDFVSRHMSVDEVDQMFTALVHAAAVYRTSLLLLSKLSYLKGSHSKKCVEDIRDALDRSNNIENQNYNLIVKLSESYHLRECLPSKVSSPFVPCSQITIEHEQQLIIFSIRGTVQLNDAITDITANVVPFLEKQQIYNGNTWDECNCDSDHGNFAHAGFTASAWQLAKLHLPTISSLLRKHQNYSLLLTGHSMGGAVASLLTMLLHSNDEDIIRLSVNRDPINESTEYQHSKTFPDEDEEVVSRLRECHCIIFGPPAVTTLKLSVSARPYITSVILGKDVIPSLSVLSVNILTQRLKDATVFQRTLGQVGDSYIAPLFSKEPNQIHVDRDRHNNMIELSGEKSNHSNIGLEPHSDNCTVYKDSRPLRDLRDASFLSVPGRVLHIGHIRSSVPRVSVRHNTSFSEIQLPSLLRAISDHNLLSYLAVMRMIRNRKHSTIVA